MQRKRVQALRSVDPWLLISLLALLCVGLLMVYSASMAESYATYRTPYFYLEHEIIWVAVGLVALAAAIRVPYTAWRRFAGPLFALTALGLALVLVPHLGHMSNGARRWFSLGGFEIQPSEMIKLTMVVYLAAWLESKGERVRDFAACFFPLCFMLGVVGFLVLKEPDLGTTIIICITMFSVYFVAGGNLSYLLWVFAGAGLLGWLDLQHQSYQSDRLTAFLNPWQDPSGVGYHTIQALLALGSGGLIGDGLGNSAQKYVLPAPHTDSILAVIGEELGLVGTVGVLILFLIVAYRGMRIANQAPDQFARLLAAGITSWIMFQALLNFAVITSSVPFTGVPLPFISYGGSALVVSMVAVGILLNISRSLRAEGVAHHDSDNGRRDGRSHLSRPVRRSASPRRSQQSL